MPEDLKILLDFQKINIGMPFIKFVLKLDLTASSLQYVLGLMIRGSPRPNPNNKISKAARRRPVLTGAIILVKKNFNIFEILSQYQKLEQKRTRY